MTSCVRKLILPVFTLLPAGSVEAQAAEREVTRTTSELAAANGITGAGTSFGAEASVRAWAEIGISRLENITAVWSVFGGGLRLHESIEVEALMPIGYGWKEGTDVIIGSSDSGEQLRIGGNQRKQWVGNPYVGLNSLLAEGGLKSRVGAGVGLPVATWDERRADAEHLTVWAAGSQDLHLWLPQALSFVARGRLETGHGLAVDLAVILAVPIAESEPIVGDGFMLNAAERRVQVLLQPAVEIAIFATPTTLAGLRIPLVWSSQGEAGAEVSFVPFLRQWFGAAFFAAQFTLNMAPEGSSEVVWGAQLGAGAGF